MKAPDCNTDLLVRARRRTLTSTETLAWHSHLVDCPSCRLALQVAEDFKLESAGGADDSAVVLRMSAAARRWADERGRRRVPIRAGLWRPVRIAAMAASLLLMAGTVSAFWLWRHPQSAESSAKTRTTAPARRARLFARAEPAAVTPAPPPVAPEPAVSSPPASVRHASRPMSPALLLQRANEARRQGDVAQAIALYHRLQQLFPASSEAVLSGAPLGGLLLERGGARAALEQFDRYLRAAPTGVLVPEALYGRARALRALGEATEEQRTWRRLVAAFPDCPYAPLARRRLADLQ